MDTPYGYTVCLKGEQIREGCTATRIPGGSQGHGPRRGTVTRWTSNLYTRAALVTPCRTVRQRAGHSDAAEARGSHKFARPGTRMEEVQVG